MDSFVESGKKSPSCWSPLCLFFVYIYLFIWFYFIFLSILHSCPMRSHFMFSPAWMGHSMIPFSCASSTSSARWAVLFVGTESSSGVVTRSAHLPEWRPPLVPRYSATPAKLCADSAAKDQRSSSLTLCWGRILCTLCSCGEPGRCCCLDPKAPTLPGISPLVLQTWTGQERTNEGKQKKKVKSMRTVNQCYYY